MSAPGTVCPAPRELQGWLQEELAEPQQAALGRHVETCPACQAALQALVAGPGEWSDAAESLGAAAAVPTVELRDAITRLKATPAATPTGLFASICARLQLTFLDPPAASDELGRCGRYRVLEFVGRGPVGVVLKAFDERRGRYVALKFLAPTLAGDERARQRFQTAVRAAAAVEHENVMPLYEANACKGFPYLVMPLFAGPTLQARLERDGPLPVREVVRLGAQAAAGLAAFHAAGLGHGNVKPANLLFDPATGKVRLTDFGLADAGPPYAAPEPTRDARADLYSLGAVLHVLATGRPPGPDGPSAGLPPWFEAILRRLLARDRATRFASAAEVAELLQGRLEDPGPPRPIARRRRPWTLLLALAGAALAGAALALATLAALGWLHGPTPAVAPTPLPEAVAPTPAPSAPTATPTLPPEPKGPPPEFHDWPPKGPRGFPPEPKDGPPDKRKKGGPGG